MESMYLVIAFCSLWFVPSSSNGAATCDEPFSMVGNQCLMFYTLTSGSSPNMKLECTTFGTGTSLAQVNNATQLMIINKYIYDNEQNFADFWLDGSDQKFEGDWIWGDGTAVPRNSVFWAYDCPNFTYRPAVNNTRNCLILDSTHHYLFSDVDCMKTKASPICEKK